MPEALIQQNQIVPIVSPKWTSASVTNSAAQVIGTNSVRRGLLFANPSSSVTFYLAPAGASLAVNAGIPLLPGAVWEIDADGNKQVNCAWQAIASAAGPAALTILEFV